MSSATSHIIEADKTGPGCPQISRHWRPIQVGTSFPTPMDITAAFKLIIVIVFHQGTMPRVALCGNVRDEHQYLLANTRTTIYGCAIGSLQDGFELPPIGEAEPNLKFVIQQLPFFICNYKSILTVNMTRFDNRCGFKLKSDGTVSIMDGEVYEFKREAYCVAA